MTAQNMQALAQANAIRSHRAEIKRQLSVGHILFRDLDLDDPLLQTMKVEELIRALPWKVAPRSYHTYGTPKVRRAHLPLMKAAGLTSSLPLAALSPRRRDELKALVAEHCPSQRERRAVAR